MELISTVIYGFSFIFIGVLIVLLLINRKTKTTILFSLTLISLLGWIFSLYLFYQIEDPLQVLFLGRLNFVFGVVLAPSIYLFVRNFPKQNALSLLDKFVIVESLVFALLTMFTKTVVLNEIVDGTNRITEYGVGYSFFVVHFFSWLFISIFILVRKVRHSQGIEKVQNQIFLMSLVTAISFGGFTNILVPVFFSAGLLKDIETYTVIQNLGALSTVIFGIPIFISIFRFRFLDVRIILGRTVYYFLISLIFYIAFYVVTLLQNYSFGSVFKGGALLSGFVLAIIFSILFQWLDNYFAKKIDLSFINKDYDPTEVISSFNKNIGEVLDFESLSEIAYKNISKVFGVEGVSLFILTHDGKSFKKYAEQVALDWSRVEDVADEILEVWKASNFDPIVLDQFEVYFPDELLPLSKEIGHITERLNELDIRMLVPLGRDSSTYSGMLLLGRKKVNDAYSSRDVEYLSTIADTLTLAIKRSYLHEEVQKFNQTLQHKIDEATKELEARYQELREIRAKERDMMDIMGHELRTPLSIIKISMGALDIVSKKSPAKFSLDVFKPHARKIKDAILREIELLETMLTSTKIDARRLELSFEKVVMNDLVEDAILGHKQQIEDKKLQVTFENSDKQYFAYADKVRLSEVVDNLVNNGIKYTEEGSVKIKIDDSDSEMLNITITDTGIGIPKEALSRLGEKFYRVRQYINGDSEENGKRLANVVRPGGTGLGLYVTFGLIKMMGGEVHVESELGKGSVFSFKIPKFSGQKESEIRNSSKDIFQRMGLAKGKKLGDDKDQADKA